MEKRWIAVGATDSFPEGVHLTKASNRPIVVARLDGELYAFSKSCPHVGGNMERCEVVGTIISCPFHAWRFDLKNSGSEIHGYEALRVFAVRENDGEIFVAL